jgi:hypothetical protein
MNTLIVYFSKSADRLTASDLNQVKCKLIALTILFILLTACGSAEPTALLIPPTAISNPTPTPQIVYVTATPRAVEVTATPEPIALPPTPTSEPWVPRKAGPSPSGIWTATATWMLWWQMPLRAEQITLCG